MKRIFTAVQSAVHDLIDYARSIALVTNADPSWILSKVSRVELAAGPLMQ